MLVNGFLIDATGRCTFNDTDAVVGTFVGIPVTATGETAAAQTGSVVAASNRCGVNAAGRLVYQDVSQVPYAGVVFRNGGMSFTQAGALLTDSVSAILYYNGGLPYTAAGYLAIDGSTPPVPSYILTEGGDYITTEAGEYIITEGAAPPPPPTYYITTQANDPITTQSGDNLVYQ